MTLILVRHGEALPDSLNPKRPLSDRGIADIRRIATFLKNSGIPLEQIFHSTKLRARQTAEVIQKTVSPRSVIREIPGLEPDDPVDPMVSAAEEWTKNTVVVGHLPFLGIFLGCLTSADSDCPVALVTGTAVILEKNGHGHWKVHAVVSPAILR